MKLQNSLKSLILEIASIETVIDAIKNKRVMGTSYDGDEPGGKGQRLIEPVCVGISKAGNRVVRAWEREGASHTATIGSQPLPGWRLFRLDKTFTFLPTNEVFNEVRPGFNPNGDKSMVSIEAIANFSTPATPSIIPQQFQTPSVDSIIDNTIQSLKEFVQLKNQLSQQLMVLQRELEQTLHWRVILQLRRKAQVLFKHFLKLV